MGKNYKATLHLLPLCFFLAPFFGWAQVLQFCNGSSGDPIFTEDFGTGTAREPLQLGSTSYNFEVVNAPNDGSYTISHDASPFFGWHGGGDHTPNDVNGRYLMVNASFTAGEFYQRTVTNLCEDTTYEFSSWLINLLPLSRCGGAGIPINVRFEILDSTGTHTLAWGDTGEIFGTTSPVWEQYGLVFKTDPGQTSVILKMINNGSGGCGNDLGIDDIAFRSCGDRVTVTNTTNNPSVVLCGGDGPTSITLTADTDGSVFSTYAYQWQQSTDGSTWADINGAHSPAYTTPAISSDRYYRVKVAENSLNVSNAFCNVISSTFEASFVPNPAPPISNGDITFCEGASAALSVQVPQNVLVNWYDAPTGGTMLHNGTLFPTQSAGTYYAEAISTMSSCPSINRTAVQAIMAENPEVTDERIQRCAGSTITLSANFPNATYLWSTKETTENIDVAQGGIYTVTVTNAQSCSSTKTITVVDQLPVDAPPISGETVFCEGTTATIAVQAAANTSIDWYDRPSGGSPLLKNSSTYQPPSSGTYYAEAVSTTSGCISATRTPITVTIHESPVVQDEIVEICEDATVRISAGFPNATYLWNTGAATEAISVTEPGTYTVTVTNDRSCSRTKTIEVRQLDVPDLPISQGDVQVCGDQSGTLSVAVSENIIVDWYDHPTAGFLLLEDSAVYETSVGGTYYAQARSSISGCEANMRTAVQFVQLDQPELTNETMEICEGDTMVLSAGFPNASYLWNTGETTETIEIQLGGTYSVTVTNELSCSGTKTIEVVQLPAPDAPISAGDVSICSGERGILRVQAPLGTTINWYDAPTGGDQLFSDSAIFVPTASGTYYAEAVSVASGCASTSRTAVTFTDHPSPELTDEALEICEGNTEILSAGFPDASYLWSTGETSEYIEVDQAGTYSVTVTNAQSCSSVKTITVGIVPLPSPPTSDGDAAFCENEMGTISVQVPSGNTVYWYDSPSGGTLLMENSTRFAPSVSGVYYAEAVSSQLGCTSTSRTAVRFDSFPVPAVMDEALEICEGATTTLSADFSNATYLWNTGETTESIVVDRAGTYTVTVTNEHSCSATKTFVVAHTTIPVIESVRSNAEAIIVTTQGGGAFQYSLDGINFQDSPVFDLVEGGRYTIYVRNGRNCPPVEQEFLHLVIPKFFTPNGDGRNDGFRPQGVEYADFYEIAIYNRLGALLARSESVDFSWDGNHNNTALPASDYWYAIQIDNTVLKGHVSLKR